MKRSVLFALLLSACQSAPMDPITPLPPPAQMTMPSDDTPALPAPQPGYTQLRLVHASPDAPAVDVYARGSSAPLASNLFYGEATEYLIVASGAYTIDVRPAGADAASAPVYSVGPLTLAERGRVTAVAAGLLGGKNADDSFRVLTFADGFTPPADGNARVRILHLSPDAPSVDIDVGDDGTAELTGLARYADSGVTGVDLPAGQELQIGIRAGGARVTAFTTKALADGAELFVMAEGLLGKTPREQSGFVLRTLDAHAVVRTIRQNPTVYALHAGPDAPSVDVFVGNAEIIDDLRFGGLSAPVQVKPGTYSLDIFGHIAGSVRPAHAPVASAATPALAAGERYLVQATGFLAPGVGDAPFQLVAISDGFDSSTTAVRAVHSSPDAPKVDIGVAVGDQLTNVLAAGLSFTQSSDAGGLTVTPGTLRLGVAAAGTTQAAALFTIAFNAGVRPFVIAAGALSPTATQQSFRLVVVDTATWPWTATNVAPH